MEEVVRAKGIQIKTPDIPNGGGHVIFAQYEESGRITIFMDCIKKAEELIAGEQMEDLFKGADLFSVLLAHELFHAVEQEKRKQYLPRQKRLNSGKDRFPTNPAYRFE